MSATGRGARYLLHRVSSCRKDGDKPRRRTRVLRVDLRNLFDHLHSAALFNYRFLRENSAAEIYVGLLAAAIDCLGHAVFDCDTAVDGRRGGRKIRHSAADSEHGFASGSFYIQNRRRREQRFVRLFCRLYLSHRIVFDASSHRFHRVVSNRHRRRRSAERRVILGTDRYNFYGGRASGRNNTGFICGGYYTGHDLDDS
jgi:hypothetical protein